MKWNVAKCYPFPIYRVLGPCSLFDSNIDIMTPPGSGGWRPQGGFRWWMYIPKFRAAWLTWKVGQMDRKGCPCRHFIESQLFFLLLFFQVLRTWSHHWHTTAPHVVRSYRSGPFNKSTDRSETIIFPMDHQQLGAAGSNRYSWIRWSCPHATCQTVTNNRIAAHYSLT